MVPDQYPMAVDQILNLVSAFGTVGPTLHPLSYQAGEGRARARGVRWLHYLVVGSLGEQVLELSE